MNSDPTEHVDPWIGRLIDRRDVINPGRLQEPELSSSEPRFTLVQMEDNGSSFFTVVLSVVLVSGLQSCYQSVFIQKSFTSGMSGLKEST